MIQDIFQYNNFNNRIELNTPEILLIREFAALMTPERNICDEDKTGLKGIRAFKEFTYIYLAICWKSPYSDFPEQERHKEALNDSGLTEEEFNDETFRAACRRYKQLQDASSTFGKLAETYRNTVHKMQVFIDNIDYSERKDNGEPVFKIKDTLLEMQSLSKALDALEEFEQKFRQEKEESSGLRGDQEAGYRD